MRTWPGLSSSVALCAALLVLGGCGDSPAAQPAAPPPPTAIAHPTGSTFTIENPLGGEAIKVEVLQAGNGKVAQRGRYVTMHHVGKVQGGKTYFNSREKKAPKEFAVGLGSPGIVPGWDAAASRMREGDLWKVTIPPELAYGKHGGPHVPSNSTIVLELEMLQVE